MSFFYDVGRLITEPTLKCVPIKGEQQAITELFIAFPNAKPLADGEFEERTLKLNASIFGSLAEPATKLLKRGAKVVVVGNLVCDYWDDKQTGEDRCKYHLYVDSISPDLRDLDFVKFKPRKKDLENQADTLTDTAALADA